MQVKFRMSIYENDIEVWKKGNTYKILKEFPTECEIETEDNNYPAKSTRIDKIIINNSEICRIIKE